MDKRPTLYEMAANSILQRCTNDLASLCRHRACFTRLEIIARQLDRAGVSAVAHCGPDGRRLEIQIASLTTAAECAIEQTGHFVCRADPHQLVIHSTKDGDLPIWITETHKK